MLGYVACSSCRACLQHQVFCQRHKGNSSFSMHPVLGCISDYSSTFNFSKIRIPLKKHFTALFHCNRNIQHATWKSRPEPLFCFSCTDHQLCPSDRSAKNSTRADTEYITNYRRDKKKWEKWNCDSWRERFLRQKEPSHSPVPVLFSLLLEQSGTTACIWLQRL